MSIQFKPYQERPIRFAGTTAYNGWNMKQYSISVNDEYVQPALFEAATTQLEHILPREPVNDSHYGVGFLILHEGYDGNYIIASWWVGENMLCNHILAAPAESPYEFKSFRESGIVACVWELEIMYFEKRLWSQAVLQNSQQPDFDRYLSIGFSGNI